MVILLILILGTVTGYDLQCPAKSEWHWRANVSCISEDKYVCLFHLLENKYKENCLGSDLSSIGSKLVFQPLFNLAECNTGRYQPIVFTTYGNSECILIKSKCKEEGQVVYSNASTKSDIACRCDYTKGYAFISKPKKSCFCLPSEEDCSCFRTKCSNLSSDYQCITDGVIKPKTTCQEIQQKISLNKDKLTVKSIDSNTQSDMGVSDAHQVSYIIIFTITVTIVIIVITTLKSYVFVPPKMFLPKTISYDQGGKTTVLKCNVRSYLPLKSAVWCRLLPNNECLDKKSRIVLNGKGLRTIIFETSGELEYATYKCKACNIFGAVESPTVKLNEKENDEPLASSTPSLSTNDDIQTDIHELFPKEECGKHYFARVIFIGKEGVGKTSLMRRLLWGTKDQSSSTQSTDGIDIKKCNINVKNGKWSPCNEIDHDLARLIKQVYTDKKKSVDEAKGLTINKSEDVQRKSSSSSEDSNAGSDKNFIIQENITHDYRIKVGSQSIQDEKETHESSLNVINHKMNDGSTNIDVTCVDEMKGEEKNNINFESGENLKK